MENMEPEDDELPPDVELDDSSELPVDTDDTENDVDTPNSEE